MHLSRTGSLFFGLAALTSALQVTPNSPCSTLCMDDTNNNPSDPNSSNTYGTDITCNNADFNTTFIGEKFQGCLNCLQNSAYTSGTESDQSWFLYNLRYALDWCVFGYPSNDMSVGGPCSIGSACGTLSTALETEILSPSEGSTFDYCSADSGAFQDQNVIPCTNCLMGLSSNSYLANFLVALQAGCKQQPAGSLVIGLNETVFTSTQVAITTASMPASTSGATTSSGLSLNAKIGIIVAGIIVLLIIIGVSIISYKKRQRTNVLASRRIARFSAPETSATAAGRFFNLKDMNTSTKEAYAGYDPREFHSPEGISPGELKSSSSVSTEYSLKTFGQPSSSPYIGGVLSAQQGYNQNSSPSENPSPINSAQGPIRTYSNSSSGVANPRSSVPIRTRNFSTPTGATAQSPASASTRSPLISLSPYSPSAYAPRAESSHEEQP